MNCVLITGANRGLGLEFAHKCLARGDHVFAGYRKQEKADDLAKLAVAYPSLLTTTILDVTEEATIQSSLATVKSHVEGLDLLINNAGVSPDNETLANLNAETMLHAFHVNSIGPVIISQHFLNLLRTGSHSKIINISTQMGSLEQKNSGGYYSYCSSKAALNMLTRALAFDIRSDGIIVVAMHPGWVQTDMGGRNASLKPSESVQGMLEVIDHLTLADTGKFLTWQGQVHPW